MGALVRGREPPLPCGWDPEGHGRLGEASLGDGHAGTWFWRPGLRSCETSTHTPADINRPAGCFVSPARSYQDADGNQ